MNVVISDFMRKALKDPENVETLRRATQSGKFDDVVLFVDGQRYRLSKTPPA